MQIILDGTITPVTPVAIVPPPPPGQRADRVQRLPRMPVFSDGQKLDTAYLPASSIRGRLRHTAVAVVNDCLRDAGKPAMTLSDYLFNAIGGVFDRKDDEVDNTRGVDIVAMSHARDNNPLVSLFGAMTVKLAGKLRTGSGIPLVPYQPEIINPGVRTNPFERNPELLTQFEDDEVAAFVKRNRQRVLGNKLEDEAEQKTRDLRRLRGEKADPKTIEELAAKIEKLKTESKQAFDAAGGVVNIQQPLPGYEALPIGLEMTQRMTLTDPTPLELALFLATLERFGQDPRIGGHASHESGLISARWTIRVSDGGPAEPVGEIRIDPNDGCRLEASHPIFNEASTIRAQLAEELSKCDLSQPAEL